MQFSKAAITVAVFSLGATILHADVFNMPSGQTSLQFVAVGNPGNPADARSGWSTGTFGAGSVSNIYQIDKYEVTNAQYCAFLNAKVTLSDSYGLYNTNMAADRGGIARRGSGTVSDPWSYYILNNDANWANRPVNWVSFWDAARFCNWLHNGQGNGDTETGAYINIGNQASFARQPDAKYFLPTEDEWYKAAYYDPKKPGGAGYWTYPTKSDTPPINTVVSPDPGNHGNFYDGLGMGNNSYTLGGPYWTTPVGEFENSASAYGTFDQGGNLWEWNETSFYLSYRGMRSGAVDSYPSNFAASYQGTRNPSDEMSALGFRVAAAVPEPSTFALLGAGAIGLLGYAWRRR